jgi:hypothetical protein
MLRHARRPGRLAGKGVEAGAGRQAEEAPDLEALSLANEGSDLV